MKKIITIVCASLLIIAGFVLSYSLVVQHQRMEKVKAITEISLSEIDEVGICHVGTGEIAHFFTPIEKETFVKVLNNAKVSLKPRKEEKGQMMMGGPPAHFRIKKTDEEIIEFFSFNTFLEIDGRRYECDYQSGSRLRNYLITYYDKLTENKGS